MKMSGNEREGLMKKKWKSLISAFVLSSIVIQGPTAVVQADQVRQVSDWSQRQGTITLDYEGKWEFRLKENEIRLGDSGKLSVDGVNQNMIQWKVSKPSVLSVNGQGNVETKRAGNCIVTAIYKINGQIRSTSRNIVVVDRWEAEQSKFPTGTYWNNPENPDKVTLKPCNHEEDCSSFIYQVNIAGDQLKASQCHGFALKVAADIYGEKNLSRWRKSTVYQGVNTGDIIRIYGGTHTIIVTKVYGNSIEYADCNNGDTCKILWGQVMSKAQLQAVYNYSYIRV